MQRAGERISLQGRCERKSRDAERDPGAGSCGSPRAQPAGLTVASYGEGRCEGSTGKRNAKSCETRGL